jgi:hypothetical protein
VVELGLKAKGLGNKGKKIQNNEPPALRVMPFTSGLFSKMVEIKTLLKMLQNLCYRTLALRCTFTGSVASMIGNSVGTIAKAKCRVKGKNAIKNITEAL